MTFSIWLGVGVGGGGAMSLAEVENMAALQLFTLGEILGVLRHILVHSEAHL